MTELAKIESQSVVEQTSGLIRMIEQKNNISGLIRMIEQKNNMDSFIDGQRDCRDGEPHQPGKPEAYDQGYNFQYQLEAIQGAEQ